MANSARLEIHVLNVGQGDSILIINRDLGRLRANLVTAAGAGAVPVDDYDLMPFATARYPAELKGTVVKALLIDGGERTYADDVLNALYTNGVAEPNTPYCPLLTVLITHYHSDHIAGVLNVFEKKNDQRKYEARHRPATLYYPSYDGKSDPTSLGFQRLKRHITDFQTKGTWCHQLFPGGRNIANQTVTIDLGPGVTNIPIVMRVIAANGRVHMPHNSILANGSVVNDPRGQDCGTDYAVANPAVAAAMPKDLNDRSLVGVLEYGSFLVLLTGDAAGIGTTAGGNPDGEALSSPSSHGDIEQLYVPALKTF